MRTYITVLLYINVFKLSGKEAFHFSSYVRITYITKIRNNMIILFIEITSLKNEVLLRVMSFQIHLLPVLTSFLGTDSSFHIIPFLNLHFTWQHYLLSDHEQIIPDFESISLTLKLSGVVSKDDPRFKWSVGRDSLGRVYWK